MKDESNQESDTESGTDLKLRKCKNRECWFKLKIDVKKFWKGNLQSGWNIKVNVFHVNYTDVPCSAKMTLGGGIMS